MLCPPKGGCSGRVLLDVEVTEYCLKEHGTEVNMFFADQAGELYKIYCS